jgi:hypothetical protein
MRALALMLLAGCAIDAPALAPANPASISAPTGRLAGAPATLRPGVVAYPGLPAITNTAPPIHHHHGQ